MKIISWNCQGAFRKKAEYILVENPDILIIQECENPQNLVFSANVKLPKEFLWFGENKNKGIGVFSYGNYKFKLLEEYNPNFKIIVPIQVSNVESEFVVFAICANNSEDKKNEYIEQVWQAINFYENILNQNSSILIGDFNSNKIWDKKHKAGNHSDVVEKLNDKNIQSVYHNYFNEEQGKENQPTFYLYRHESKPYHIDYCFMSSNILEKVEQFEVGKFKFWSEHSDHMPIIMTLKN